MRRKLAGVCLFVVLLVVALAGSAASAQASCHSWSCVNRQLNALHGALAKADARIARDDATITKNARVYNGLVACLTEVPMTTYGDTGGTFGYTFDPGAGAPVFDSTALDVTNTGTSVDGWSLFDKCNTSTTPGAAADTKAGQITPATSAWRFGHPQLPAAKSH
jgi:hypothetical protein